MKHREGRQAEARLMAASDWLQQVNRHDVSEGVLQQWLNWCSESEDNQRAYEQVQTLYGKIREASPEYRDALRRLADAPSGAADSRSMLFSLFRSRRWLAVAMSALVVVAAGLMLQQWYQSRSSPAQSYATARGEHRTLTLQDGSELALGADSMVQVEYRKQRRLVDIHRGEAYFTVKRNHARPFVVRAGTVQVTAVGTAFDVLRASERVTVAVTEGAVDVLHTSPQRAADDISNAGAAGDNPDGNSPRASESRTDDAGNADSKSGSSSSGSDNSGNRTSTGPTGMSHSPLRLTAGHRTVFLTGAGPTSDALPPVSRIDPVVVTAWLDGRLQFAGEPLSVVIESVNRYSHTKVVIGDRDVGDLTYTGTVLREHADEWIVNLPEVFPLRAVRAMDGTVILMNDE